jgi:hypothetical protein
VERCPGQANPLRKGTPGTSPVSLINLTHHSLCPLTGVLFTALLNQKPAQAYPVPPSKLLRMLEWVEPVDLPLHMVCGYTRTVWI